MKRRTVVAASVGVLALGGCSATNDRTRQADGGNNGGTVAPTTTSTDGARHGHRVHAELNSEASTEQTVRIVASADGETLVDEVAVAKPREKTYVDLGITERGDYRIAVTVEDARERSFPFTIDERALERGSNVVLIVHDDPLDLQIIVPTSPTNTLEPVTEE